MCAFDAAAEVKAWGCRFGDHDGAHAGFRELVVDRVDGC